MSRHLADHRTTSTGARVKQFLRLARGERPAWHKSRDSAGQSRLIQFLRIARGRTS